MYSKIITETLKKQGIEVGDKIAIKKGEKEYEGVLMPRTQGEQNILVIKLENGYNIGFSFEDCEIKLIKKGEIKKTEEKVSEGKGEVAILGCGGTISSKIEYKTGAVYPVISPKELFTTFPHIKNIAEIKVKKVFSLLSEDMTQQHWQILAKNVAEEINDGAKGVVVMHGTDTMSYTTAALSFMLQNLPVPVVFVGAQRSSDRPSSDNELNLLNSIWAAKKSDIAEVIVCMHATQEDNYCYLHRGTKVRKFHNSRRDAFKSVNSLPLAAVDYRKNFFEKIAEYEKRNEKRKLMLDTKINENVAMVYIHPGIKPSFIDSLSKYDGIVLIGTGLGHMPTNPFDDPHAHSIYKNIKSLVDSGISVVMATQTIFGRINMNVYSTGRLLKEAGIIGDGADWTPELAFVKLCWVLGREKKPEKVKELMMKNICGELNERSPIQKGYEI